MALPQAVVPVHPASPWRPGVVEVHAAEPVQAHKAVKRFKGLDAALFTLEVIACCKGMAGIQAETCPGGLGYPVEDGGQMLEAVSDAAPLPCGVFQNQPNPLCLF